ncbi:MULTISPECIES: transposase [Clostridium]|uniref:Transposase n=2 Tax=Clostridium aquiflavi TaxID=3073603 RepID=A0ABU1EI98_9CLOT|nr:MULTISPECIES: transposase [unclassified Clostridium]MDR5588095.1 transposase [Clostridium sp. 5N-1]
MVGITNAFIEGINNTIRAIEKQGRGYDFDILRAKTIFFINHKIIKTSFKTDAVLYSQSFIEEELKELYTIKDRDYGVDFKDLTQAINEGLL